ncbi:MAG: UDP-4-amino-4,6-dideoxy-N-acetyl-beta-L-altrosamine N-acetyltransferase [Gammaproteobacteria bacterium]|nr:UDP-4-amino-4,6-dideoxy-N-acetyl-beta-L-altrosamine N-acetyltransferase [Gammaproteobacteria bacterium]
MDKSDLDKVLAWRNDQSIRRYMLNNQEIPAKEHYAWFDRVSIDPISKLYIYENHGIDMGFISFKNAYKGSISEWGFYKSPDAPKGVGLDLGKVALQTAFTDLNIHKVYGNVIASNTKSVLLHQTLGFDQEGILKEHHFDGENYHDLICFGLIKYATNTLLK